MKHVLLLLLCLFASTVLAQSKTKEELIKIYAQAEADYKVQRYAEALPAYELLYRETGQSNMMFNIAQCQRELQQYTAALSSYRKFLQEQPQSPLRAEIESTIAELEAKQIELAEPVTQPKSKKKLIWFGASGGLLAVSAATGLSAISISRSAQETGGVPASQRSKGIALAAISDTCLLGTAATLYLGLRSAKRERALTVTPTDGGAVVSLSLSAP